MATRHNACPNPACGMSVAGWGGGVVPSRVTGLVGYGRTTGARYTGGSFLRTPTGAAGPGDTVTASLDVLTEAFNDPSVDVYLYATRSAGGDVQVGAVINTSLILGVVARLSITRTCPALTTGVYMIVDSINMALSPVVATAVLVEVTPSAGSYFDGTAPGPPLSGWDGTPELSPSTLLDAPPAGATSWEWRAEQGPPWARAGQGDDWMAAGQAPDAWMISQG